MLTARDGESNVRAHPVENPPAISSTVMTFSGPQPQLSSVIVVMNSLARPPWRVGGTSERPAAQFVGVCRCRGRWWSFFCEARRQQGTRAMCRVCVCDRGRLWLEWSEQ